MNRDIRTASAQLVGSGMQQLAALATGRGKSLFQEDLDRCRAQLRAEIEGRRILVIGGAGSIGAATVRTLVQFSPAALHVLDQNENGLAELVRDFRSTFEQLPDLRTLPMNFGSPIMQRFLQHEEPYDFVLNFAALKHVRSEKDGYSILQMLDTNVVKPVRLLEWLIQRGGVRRYFCVSTDKAANPVNLMGASKRLMEHVIFSDEVLRRRDVKVSSARFANVAFSDGSLLQGWLMRMAKGQPLAAPRETRRYFVSLEEAGQICVLAAFLASDAHLLVPRLDATKDLLLLSDLAVKVLQQFGYAPRLFDDESAARRATKAGESNEYYPLLLTPLDTSGEKPYEEFVGEGECSVEVGMKELAGVPYVAAPPGVLKTFLTWVETRIDSAAIPVRKEEVVSEIQKVLPEFHHMASTKSLDQRL
jgi:FlaA1/EpsC-like NDP-sugar epimerase